MQAPTAIPVTATPHAGRREASTARGHFRPIPETDLTEGLRDLSPLLAAVENLFKTHSAQDIANHGRFERVVSNGKDFLMPARLGNFDALRWISRRPENEKAGLDNSQSDLLIRDARTGLPLCQLSGIQIGAVKSPLVVMSALKVWQELHQVEDIRLGIIGGGPVARGALRAAHQIMGDKISSVMACSKGDSARAMVADFKATRACEWSPKEELLARANVIISATSNKGEPLINMSDLKPDRGPIFIAPIGYGDLHPGVYDRASQIISEDPISYAKSDLPLANFMRTNFSREFTALSSILQKSVPLSRSPITVMAPYGTAMADLAIALALPALQDISF